MRLVGLLGVAVMVAMGCGSSERRDAGTQCPPGLTEIDGVCTTGCEDFGPPSAPVGCECGTVVTRRCQPQTFDCGRCDAGFTCTANTCRAADGGQ
ncbi:MAG: hypothetical protein ACO1OB_21175 [Archangium sp.]